MCIHLFTLPSSFIGAIFQVFSGVQYKIHLLEKTQFFYLVKEFALFFLFVFHRFGLVESQRGAWTRRPAEVGLEWSAVVAGGGAGCRTRGAPRVTGQKRGAQDGESEQRRSRRARR